MGKNQIPNTRSGSADVKVKYLERLGGTKTNLSDFIQRFVFKTMPAWSCCPSKRAV